MEIVNRLIQKLGKKNYRVDPVISLYDIVLIILQKILQLLRGYFLKFRLRKSSGILFLGRRTTILFAHKISIGKAVTIEDNVEINALSKNGVIIGNNVTIKKNSIIECTGVIRELGEGIIIGNNVGISQGAFIQVRGSVIIGSNVMFGPHVSIFSENHSIENSELLLIEQPSIRRGVTIEDNVWIGANSTILDGVTIGTGSVIAAGSIVTKDIPPYSVAAGVPALVKRNRKE